MKNDQKIKIERENYMEIGEFKRVFQIASSQIIDTAIKLGYINSEKKEELELKLNEYLQNEVAYEMRYKEEAAEFNPNTHTMAFNVSKISSVQEAMILILHEEKHILDYYVDEKRGFFDELYDHVGIQDKDGNGIGQNESCTERFAVDVAEEILGETIESKNFQAIGLNFDSNMPNFHIEDYLNRLLCEAMQIPMGDLLIAQNGRSLEEFGKIANSFNEVADYNKFRGAIDEIYRIIYVGDDSLFSAIYDENQARGTVIQKKIDEYSENELEKIGRIHKLIQIAQNEIMQYVSKNDPSRIDEIKSKCIITAPEFELTEQDEFEFDSKYPRMDAVYTRRKQIADNSVSDFLKFMREELETEEITTRKLGEETVQEMQDVDVFDSVNSEMERQERTINQTKENQDLGEK